jgi:hypothetical protein
VPIRSRTKMGLLALCRRWSAIRDRLHDRQTPLP